MPAGIRDLKIKYGSTIPYLKFLGIDMLQNVGLFGRNVISIYTITLHNTPRAVGGLTPNQAY